MKFIVLDTNFLIYVAKCKLDLEEELDRICEFTYKIVLPHQVIDELNELTSTGKGKDKEAAALALQISKDFEIKKVTAKSADDAVLALSVGNVIATMDKELRKRFKNAKKGKILSIRQRKHLSFT